jgi:transposase
MFTDVRRKKMFEVSLGRSNKKLIEQVMKIPGRMDVKLVSIDMSGTYKSFVKLMFPNAKIVSDKFHVLRLFNPAIMTAGKKVHGHRQELKTRRKLLNSRVKLDYWLRSDIDFYLKEKPELKELYTFKEKLFELYRTKGHRRASLKLEKLIERMKASKLKAIKKLGRTLSRWQEEVSNYFKYRITNAFT